MRRLLLAAAMILAASSAHAANIYHTTEDGFELIWITGKIEKGDDDKYVKVDDTLPKNAQNVWVILSGPGGDAWPAMGIGDYIHRSGYNTQARGECSSACAAIWIAGKQANAAKNSLIVCW
jgi:hypothetical protein